MRFYDLALKVAQESTCIDKHGCVIAKGSRVLSLGANRFVTHPKSALYQKLSIHAEMRALIKVGNSARGATLYSARAHENANSKPCEMCHTLAIEAGIKRIVYHDGGTIVSCKL